MDDLNARLDQLLSDPSLGDKIEGLLKELGGDAAADDGKRPADTDADALAGLFGKVDLSALGSLLSAGDDGGRLLRALAPYLRPSRRKKIAQAEKILAVCRLLPVLTAAEKDADRPPR